MSGQQRESRVVSCPRTTRKESMILSWPSLTRVNAPSVSLGPSNGESIKVSEVPILNLKIYGEWNDNHPKEKELRIEDFKHPWYGESLFFIGTGSTLSFQTSHRKRSSRLLHFVWENFHHINQPTKLWFFLLTPGCLGNNQPNFELKTNHWTPNRSPIHSPPPVFHTSVTGSVISPNSPSSGHELPKVSWGFCWERWRKKPLIASVYTRMLYLYIV